MHKVAIISTQQWIFPVRIVKNFAAAGALVAIICPKNNLLARTSAAAKVYRLSALNSKHDINSALEEWAPDLVITCDDDAAFRLHSTYDIASAAVRRIIERSQGKPESFETISSKSRMMKLASKLGILCPDTDDLNIPEGRETLGQKNYPYVIKLDYAFSGKGVRIVNTPEEAHNALTSLHRSTVALRDVLRAAKRRSLWHLTHWIRSREVSYSGQALIAGSDANLAVFCQNGVVVASNAVQVAVTSFKNGPGAIVRFVDHQQMSDTAKVIVSELNLSGYYGFDFIIEDETNLAYLIEVNPRATPIVHLTSNSGVNLVEAAYRCSFGTLPHYVPPPVSRDLVAMFPYGLKLAEEANIFDTVFLDVPWDEPWLLSLEAYENKNNTLARLLEVTTPVQDRTQRSLVTQVTWGGDHALPGHDPRSIAA